LKAYSIGLKVNFTTHDAAAVPHLLRAIRIDLKFAFAWTRPN
jgi:hypothetical protein